MPYLPLLSLDRLYVTDDGFTSDIFNGELPLRVLTGRLLAEGQAPVWTSKLCSGMPLAAGNALDPVSLLLFASQPTARALCLYVIFLLLVASHGAFGLARRLGTDRMGAVLAGIAFAGSGYLVTQLKHLAIVSTVVWLPWGLLLLDRALSRRTSNWLRDPGKNLVLFGLVYATQVLAGFPQSAYISSLVYVVWAFVLLCGLRQRWRRMPLALPLGAIMVAVMTLGAACGAPSLLPLLELSAHSDRRSALSFEFASMLPYSWRDLLNFLIPYANGDIADLTYKEKGLFWENYGYVGAATFVLAVWAGVRCWRQPRVLLLCGLALGSLLLVLGRNTPVFYFVWKYLPGMQSFRFPTRFLVVVDLMIALLGAIGLTQLRLDLQRVCQGIAAPLPRLLSGCVVFGTALDLFANQTHQNPYVSAAEWLAPPAAVSQMGATAQHARLYTPLHSYLHRIAYQRARGWVDLSPYRELREAVAPNTGLYWQVATADCYAAIAPRWYVDAWGDHTRGGLLIPPLIYWGNGVIVTHPGLPGILASYGVTHLLSSLEIRAVGVREIESGGATHLYALPGKRARIVPEAHPVVSSSEAVELMLRTGFDSSRQVLLHDVPIGSVSKVQSEGRSQEPFGTALIEEERTTRLRLSVNAPQGGYLVLNDTYYPGWSAFVDGVEVPVHRANISVRAVKLPVGAREVEFKYVPVAFHRGLMIAGIALTVLLGMLAGLQYRSLRHRTSPESIA